MDPLTEHLKLITRSPVWAITPDAFAALLAQITSGKIFAGDSRMFKPATTLSKGQPSKVTVIPVQGVLTKDCDWCGTTYGSIANAAEQAAADPRVKRIVLAVDSPGGEVTGLPETADVIRQVAKVKPVSAIVEGTSASAAYWLTTQARDITMAPSAEVGSVGVRMVHTDISKMLDNAGIKITEMSAGKFKTEWSSFKPLSEDAQADMQKRLDDVHANFLKDVGQGRRGRATTGIAAAQFGGGRMFSSQESLRHGLVDAVQAPRDFYRSITQVTDTGTRQMSDTSTRRARLALERVRLV
jgi:capsid assembly protease